VFSIKHLKATQKHATDFSSFRFSCNDWYHLTMLRWNIPRGRRQSHPGDA